MIAYTSRLSLRETVRGLAGLQAEVYAAILAWPGEGAGPSIQELAVRLRRKEGSICGRIDKLRADGCIVDGPLKPGGCGRPVKTYTACAWRETVLPVPVESPQLSLPLEGVLS
jgi:predicted ArsR family transcriptional regulator